MIARSAIPARAWYAATAAFQGAIVENIRKRRRSVGCTPPDHMDYADDSHDEDPLVVSTREYEDLALRVCRALAPLVARRGDAGAIDAVEAIACLATCVSAEIDRAVRGRAETDHSENPVQTDVNASAKTAVLMIGESRAAWQTLMDAGRAAANGVPARAVNMLDALEAAVRARFPRLAEFVSADPPAR